MYIYNASIDDSNPIEKKSYKYNKFLVNMQQTTNTLKFIIFIWFFVQRVRISSYSKMYIYICIVDVYNLFFSKLLHSFSNEFLWLHTEQRFVHNIVTYIIQKLEFSSYTRKTQQLSQFLVEVIYKIYALLQRYRTYVFVIWQQWLDPGRSLLQ